MNKDKTSKTKVTELNDQDLEKAQGGGTNKAAQSPKPAQAGKGDSHKKEIDILSM